MFEVYEDNDYVHLVMENCTGGALKEMFEDSGDESGSEGDQCPESCGSLETLGQQAARGKLRLTSELEIKKIIRKILYSVKLLHDTGICHRDLKLDNIMFAKASQDSVSHADIRIVDFGLSTEFNNDRSPLGTFTSVVGTPPYLAPEVLSGSYNQKCDIWAAGVIAYQLFSQGSFPFTGDSEIGLYKAILRRDIYLPPREKQTTSQSACSSADNKTDFDWTTMMSEDAKNFVSCLLTKDVAKRPSARQALNHKWLSIDSNSYKSK